MSIFSPAKINLYLHITGKRDDGYHLLDSLVAFTDIGDTIDISPSDHFRFKIDGPYAGYFSEEERHSTPNSKNIIVIALRTLSRRMGKPLNFSVKLTKNMPLASGIGGGSSNAASAIWGALRYWDVQLEAQELTNFMLEIGADVPVCYRCETVRMRDIGIPDKRPIEIPEIPIILVNPGKSAHTADIFKKFKASYKDMIDIPDQFRTSTELIGFLKQTDNALYAPALQTIPEIENVIHNIRMQTGCSLARMSGSGATCFGLFENEEQSITAFQKIKEANPDWWVRAGWLGRSGRY